jgi:hypothetical protein
MQEISLMPQSPLLEQPQLLCCYVSSLPGDCWREEVVEAKAMLREQTPGHSYDLLLVLLQRQ